MLVIPYKKFMFVLCRSSVCVTWSSRSVVSSKPSPRAKSCRGWRNAWRARRRSSRRFAQWEVKWTTAKSSMATCVSGLSTEHLPFHRESHPFTSIWKKLMWLLPFSSSSSRDWAGQQPVPGKAGWAAVCRAEGGAAQPAAGGPAQGEAQRHTEQPWWPSNRGCSLRAP